MHSLYKVLRRGNRCRRALLASLSQTHARLFIQYRYVAADEGEVWDSLTYELMLH